MQGSAGVNQRSICLKWPMSTKEPLTNAKRIAGVKGHTEISWGQPEVNLLRKALRLRNLQIWYRRTTNRAFALLGVFQRSKIKNR